MLLTVIVGTRAALLLLVISAARVFGNYYSQTTVARIDYIGAPWAFCRRPGNEGQVKSCTRARKKSELTW